MLKYLIETTESLMTAGLLIGLILGFAGSACGLFSQQKAGLIAAQNGKTARRILGIGVCAGLIAAGVMAYMKNATRKIDTSLWNLRNFTASLVILLLFFIFWAIRSGLQKKKPAAARVLETAAACLLALLEISFLLYALPDTLGAPYVILMTEKSVLSTNFLYKLTGIVLGILLVFLAGLAVKSCTQRLRSKQATLLMSLALIVNAVRQVTVCLRIMLTKRIIASNKTLFEISKFSSNHDKLFLYLVMAATAIVPLLLWLHSLNVKEPYNTPAEHRKIRWKWKVSRRWSALAGICLVFTVFSFVILKPITTRAVELSPVEDAEVRDGAVYVPFERVEDGHLHRFGYVTEGDTQIRFIVIKKPNSSSYGIGLDACDICGETGYYEKDGQVVCKLCDVVMNINTIGFKGGCNPIVIEYRLENGNIIVPVESLLEYEKEFK